MKAKHTPGPWWIGGNDTQVIANIPGYTTNWVVAECRIREPVLGGIETFPSAANAKLIAAAPDLLAACHAVVQESNGRNHGFHCASKSGGDCNCAVGLARAAIAKAEQESPGTEQALSTER